MFLCLVSCEFSPQLALPRLSLPHLAQDILKTCPRMIKLPDPPCAMALPHITPLFLAAFCR